MTLVSILSGGYNLHRFSDAIGLFKICEHCFLCRSVEFCQICTKYPSCSTRSTCRGKTKPVLGTLGAGPKEEKTRGSLAKKKDNVFT